jgi:hypothetical protein
MLKTQQQVMHQGYQILFNSLGVVDALRFIQYLHSGQGDYTQERQQWLEGTSLETILSAIREYQTNDAAQYDEIIE